MSVKKLSTLPEVSAVRSGIDESVQSEDLMEISISGTPGSKYFYGPGGVETGYFSSTGWASVKCTRDEFLRSASGSLLLDISGAIFSETDSGGTYRNSGTYIVVDVGGTKYYLPLYRRTS